MTPQDLLGAQRTLYVLAQKPGTDKTDSKNLWYLKLEGLHQEQLKSAVAQLRSRERGKGQDRALKSTALQDSLAQTLGAKSYAHWREHEQPKLMELLKQHDLTQPADLIKWAYTPGLAGPLSARSFSDRIFNSGLPLPSKVFTGVGSYLFAPSGYGRLDIDDLAGQYHDSDEERYAFCSDHLNTVVLRAQHMKDANCPAYIDLTGRSLMLNAVSEYIGCMYTLLGSNLTDRAFEKPVMRTYNASEAERAFEAQLFQLFREEIEQSSEGWVEVLAVPENSNLVILKGPNGTFDWLIRDQRDSALSSNPLYPFFNKEEMPTAMDTSQLSAHLYFNRGSWHEKLEHDAESRHYAQGGKVSNWPGYDKLIERELRESHSFISPKRVPSPASDQFISHRAGDYQLMVSPLITIDQFKSFLAASNWEQIRQEKAHKAGIELEGNLLSLNSDNGDLPVSVTWLDAVAYCRHYEHRNNLKVRLLEPEEWKEIAPPPSVDRSRVQRVRSMVVHPGQHPVDPIYEQLNWAIVGGDGQLGKNSTHCEKADGVLSFGPNLHWTVNSDGLRFLSVAGFCEWLSGAQKKHAPFAEAGRGILATGAGIFGSLQPINFAMREEGSKIGFRLCYIAHPDA